MAANFGDLFALSSLLKESKELEGNGESTSSGPVKPQSAAQTASVVRTLADRAAGASGGGGGGGGSPAPPQLPPGYDAQSIWSPEEVVSVHEALAAPSAVDARKRPEFDFAFKQSVGSEDVFLGLAGTTESSVHCNTLVMRIALPGERLQDIELDCTEERVLVSAAQQCVKERERKREREREREARATRRKGALLCACRLFLRVRALTHTPLAHAHTAILATFTSRSKLSTFLPNRVFPRKATARWDAEKSALMLALPLDKTESLMG
jgi:hypothetical protein